MWLGLFVLTAAFAEPDEDPSKLELDVGKSVLLEMPAPYTLTGPPASDIAVGTRREPNLLLVSGIAPGTTELALDLGAPSEVVYEVTVVESDPEPWRGREFSEVEATAAEAQGGLAPADWLALESGSAGVLHGPFFSCIDWASTSDAAVATVEQLGPDSYLVVGQQEGETDLVMWCGSQGIPFIYAIRIGPAPTSAESAYKTVPASTKYKLRCPKCDVRVYTQSDGGDQIRTSSRGVVWRDPQPGLVTFVIGDDKSYRTDLVYFE